MRLLLYLTLPAALGMWVLAGPLTQVLFMRGAFDANDAAQTARVVEIYAGLMLFSSLSRVTSPAFYAIKNTWLPAAIAFFVLMLHIAVGPYFVDTYGLTGLATATTASSILNIVILQVFFHFWIGPLGYGSILMSALKMVPGLAVMGAFCHFVYPTLEVPLGRTLALFLVIAGSVFIYFGVTVVTGSEAGAKVLGLFRRRVGHSGKA